MPEYAELKINAHNINIYANNTHVVHVKVNPELKKQDKFILNKVIQPGDTIKAVARGKELKLIFTRADNKDISTSIIFTLGMTGYFYSPTHPSFKNHDHVQILLSNGTYLVFNDVRRFSTWRTGTWGLKRGPDPVYEYEQFITHIHQNIEKKVFKTNDIAGVLMKQEYFNGVGNYLRSTILYYADVNPFSNAYEVLKDNKNNILQVVSNTCFTALKLQLNRDPAFTSWRFYQQGNSCIDSTNRTLWYHPKWTKYCPYSS